jgi:hypothetical protein
VGICLESEVLPLTFSKKYNLVAGEKLSSTQIIDKLINVRR